MAQLLGGLNLELKPQHLQWVCWKGRKPCSTTRHRRYSATHCSMYKEGSSPKTGAVGSQRLKEGALPGTYWSNDAALGDSIKVAFNKGTETVIELAKVGENLLRVAERCGVMVPNPDFCFEGSCCHCEMEVIGGASEASSDDSNMKVEELVRGCLCAVPARDECVQVNMINEEDVWGEQVL